MSDTIFNGETTPEVTNPQPTTTLPPEVVEFVGDGKKYRSVEEALKAVPHAQKHIQTLEQELSQLREEVSKRKTAAELLDEFKSGLPQATETTPQVAFDPDKITQIVSQALDQRTAQKAEQANVFAVTSAFTSKFGEKAEEVYNRVAEEAGLSVEMLNRLAKTSPQAVLKLAGFDHKQETGSSKITSSVRTEGAPTQPTTPSARVRQGATTKELVSAWHAAGEKIKSQST